MPDWCKYLIICAAGYLIGSVNFAKIVSKIKNKNISEMGSGNPGTMNMLRSMGLWVGILTLLLDIAKGASAALIGYYLMGDAGVMAGGLAVVTGHIFSLFLKFKGGKGVACFIGVYFVAEPIAAAIGLALLIVFLFAVKYGSIGSFLLIAGLTTAHCIIFRHDIAVICLSVAMALMVYFAHRSNFKRLFKGEENKLELMRYIKEFFGKRKKADSGDEDSCE